MKNSQKNEVIIIGAGPAGLAVAACLTLKNIPYLLLEKEERSVSSWHRHYERLHLHTAKEKSALPFLPYPEHYPRFPSRKQVIEYFELYQEKFHIRPLFGREIVKIELDQQGERKERRWVVKTANEKFEAKHLILATGRNHLPLVPSFPGEETFPGPKLHSRDYSTGKIFQHKRVLVIGAGNSGAEIALDLWEQGAQASLCIRSPIHVVPLQSLGTPTQVTNIRLRYLPEWLTDHVIAKLFLWLTVGDLSPYRIFRPKVGPRKHMRETGRVPLIDVGTIARIKKREIQVYPGIQKIQNQMVTFNNGEEKAFDVIIKATGYQPGVLSYFAQATDFFGPQGLPLKGKELKEQYPGLYFIGLQDAGTGLLREINIKAREISSAISQSVSPIFNWSKRMKQFYTYHPSLANRATHWLASLFIFAGAGVVLTGLFYWTSSLVSFLSLFFLFLLFLLVIPILWVFFRIDFWGGLLAMTLMVTGFGLYHGLSLLPHMAILGGMITITSALLLQFLVGHKFIERSDTNLKGELEEFFETKDPMVILLIFYFPLLDFLRVFGRDHGHGHRYVE